MSLCPMVTMMMSALASSARSELSLRSWASSWELSTAGVARLMTVTLMPAALRTSRPYSVGYPTQPAQSCGPGFRQRLTQGAERPHLPDERPARLRRSYPKENADLQERIARDGLVISQFLPDAPPTKSSFPMRNAVMSGYSAATVVVEAPYRGGARMQARLALEHGRQVSLLESVMVNDWAQSYARKPNTTVVRTVDDVLDHLKSALITGQDLVWA